MIAIFMNRLFYRIVECIQVVKWTWEVVDQVCRASIPYIYHFTHFVNPENAQNGTNFTNSFLAAGDFAWQPYGSQLTIFQDLPASTRKFKEVDTILGLVGYGLEWINILG